MQAELLALRQKYRDGLIVLGEYLAGIDAALDATYEPPPEADAEATKSAAKGAKK